MSYLTPAASTTQHGVVEIGANIDVTSPGIISLPQSIAATANPTFATVSSTGNITANGNVVVETVTATAGPGISITGATAGGPAAAFTVNNIGVTSLIAGTNITLSGATGAVTISASAAPVVATTVTTVDYTALPGDEYIGVNSALPVTITLPLAIDGKIYIVKDEFGAGSGVITVTGTAGELIDTLLTFASAVPFASATFIGRAGAWHVT